MSAATLIAGKDLRLRIRDRSALIIGILAPLVLAYIFNLIFGGATTGTGLGLEYGLVDGDQSEISTTFGQVLDGAAAEDVLTVDRFDDRTSAETAVEEGDIDAYFFIPSGFGAAATTNQTSTIEIVGDIDSPTSTAIAESFAQQFASGIASGQLAVGTTAQIAGVAITPEFVGSLSQDPAAASASFTLSDESAATKQLDPTTYLAAGMSVFFLFFTVQFGVSGLLEEERDGTLARLMTAPIPRASVIIGKGLLSFLLGVISMAVLIVATTLLMGADWGAPLGVTILVVAGVLSAVGIMGLVAAYAKTPEGAGNLGSIIAVILGMLGGTFFPIGASGGFLSTLTFLTPHAWFLRGLAEMADGGSWTEALPAAGAILLFAAVTSAIAWLALRKRLAT